MIELRPYQNEAVTDIQQAFREGKKHVILQAATGSGKTVMFCHLTKLAVSRGKKVLILTDRTELLLQASGSLKKFGLNSFLIQAGGKYVSNSFHVFVAMSQTLRRRIDSQYWQKFLSTIDLIIVDECHKQEFNYLFESGLIDNIHRIGFSATPKRSGKMRQLGLDYEVIINSISIHSLIQHGFLVDCDVYDIDSPDLSDVAIDVKKGDFQEKAMFKKFDSPKLYAGVVDNWLEHTPATKTIVFCCNIEHTIRTVLEFQKNGIDAHFVVSNVSKPKPPENPTAGTIERHKDRERVYNLYQENIKFTGNRREVFDWFENSKSGVLVNAGIATTGYDCPTIETVILNRATISEALFLQMVGRGSRVAMYKTHFNLLDFGGNVKRHGGYSEERLWSLWHEEGKETGIPPVKECGFDADGEPIGAGNGCRRLILASYSICPICGFRYPKKEAAEVDLVLVAAKEKRKFKKIKEMTYNELKEYQETKGHKQVWLWRQLWYKGRAKALNEFGKIAGWKPATINKAINFCKNF